LRLLALEEAERDEIGGAEVRRCRDGAAVGVGAGADRAHGRQ